MPRYREEDYSVERAVENINPSFLEIYREELETYAQDPTRQDIVDYIHSQWDGKYGLMPSGTDIRIEWAIALYQHGDWEKALALREATKHPGRTEFTDPRRKYPAEFRCDNGVYVRSLSELFIAEWLYANRIAFEYEREVYFPSCDRYAHCDFYLPEYDVYVEFWGIEKDEAYAAYRQWKEPLYERNKYCLISLQFQDLKAFRDIFVRKLKECRR